jgi:hypothetical protein
MANWLTGGVRTAGQAIVGLLLIAAAGVAALAMLLISSLIVAAGLLLRMGPARAPVRAKARSGPPVIDARRTPYGWTADVPGPHA